MTTWEAIIKVNRADDQQKRSRDIQEGIGYACALLRDEYGMSADDIIALLDNVADEVRDLEET